MVPFLLNVHPDPHDYVRLTREQLELELHNAGFRRCRILALGSGPFAAAYSQLEFMIPRLMRLIVIPPAIWLDGLIQLLKPEARFSERFPLGYAFSAEV